MEVLGHFYESMSLATLHDGSEYTGDYTIEYPLLLECSLFL